MTEKEEMEKALEQFKTFVNDQLSAQKELATSDYMGAIEISESLEKQLQNMQFHIRRLSDIIYLQPAFINLLLLWITVAMVQPTRREQLKILDKVTEATSMLLELNTMILKCTNIEELRSVKKDFIERGQEMSDQIRSEIPGMSQ